MRTVVSTLALLGSINMAMAETYIYVSKAPEETIQVFRLDMTNGKLTPVEAIAVKGAPGSLATNPAKTVLFASLRTTSSLASFRIDPKTGKLSHLSTAPLDKGANAAFVSVDRAGRWLISASYMAGKTVVHGIDDDGRIRTPSLQTIKTTMTAHAAVTDLGNRFVFVPHVSTNAVYQYRLDAKSGTLADAGKAEGGTPKAGPRHLAFHPKLNMAFTSDETGNSITAFRFDPESGLKPVQTVSTLPADFKGKNTTAEVKVHPNGKFVWVSNRGHDSLAGFAIDDAGNLKSIGHTPTEKTPRSFDIDPSGEFVFGAGEGSGKLAVFRVSTDSGALKRLHTVNVGKSLTWVMAVSP